MPEPEAYAVTYSVIATLPDVTTADEYARWLAGGHVQAVIAGGATSAAIIHLDSDGDKPRLETRYEFTDRTAFERYVREFAPALRAEGLEKFPPTRGITMERRVGVIAQRWGADTDSGK